MEPAKFGPFLRETRRQRGWTQEQLAERLHVSGAAVSKWENGKCLPDLSKLEDLADILDLSIWEVMRCEACGPEESPVPRQAAAEVFSETVKVVERKEQRRRRAAAAVLAAVLCGAALALLLHYFPVYHVAHVPLYYYDGQEISMLLYIGSREERCTAQAVLAQAERAFSDIGQSSYEEAVKTYGQLGRYCITDDRVSAETHRLDLWSARFEGRTGYMWVYYSREGFDETGERVTGSRKIPTLWRLGKNWDGNWVVMDIREHP